MKTKEATMSNSSSPSGRNYWLGPQKLLIPVLAVVAVLLLLMMWMRDRPVPYRQGPVYLMKDSRAGVVHEHGVTVIDGRQVIVEDVPGVGIVPVTDGRSIHQQQR